MKNVITLFAFFYFSTFTYSQNNKTDDLMVFLDCQSYCDKDYIKREINFINYVNDRFQSNIYILLNSQETGSGGREYTMQFIGREIFEGVSDTLTYIKPSTATDEENRQLMVQTLKLGLVRYLAKTGKGKELQISYKNENPENKKTLAPEEDPWNSWIFNLRINGFLRGDKNYSSNSFSTSASASRVTEEFKTSTNIRYNVNKNRYGEGEDAFKFTNENYNIYNTTVWSLTPHLSAGGFINAQRSDFANYDYTISLTPAVEYNLFPYSESNNHYVGFMYKVGPSYFNYKEETIFLQTEELRFQQSLSLDISFNQKWGKISGSASFGHYFHDFSKNRLSFSTYADLRLYKGLSLNFNGYFAFQRDQLNIIKGDITNDDLLTRRRQLDSNYSYFTNFGLSYRFGSLFNNVVNPRFEGGGF